MVDLGYFDPWYNRAPWWHRSIGMLPLFAILLRMLWRLVQPTHAAQGSRWEKLAAHAGHLGLYVLMLVVMVSGYLISTARGRGVNVFDWFEVPALISHLPNRSEERRVGKECSSRWSS